MATRKVDALKEKGLDALKRKSAKEKEKLTKRLAEQLKNDLSRLLSEGIEADMNFDVNHHHYQLHRCIVKSRHPSFFEILQTFLEKDISEVPSIIADHVRTIVRYIYCEEDIQFVSHLVDHLARFFTTGKLPDDPENSSPTDKTQQECGDSRGIDCVHGSRPDITPDGRNGELEGDKNLSIDSSTYSTEGVTCDKSANQEALHLCTEEATSTEVNPHMVRSINTGQFDQESDEPSVANGMRDDSAAAGLPGLEVMATAQSVEDDETLVAMTSDVSNNNCDENKLNQIEDGICVGVNGLSNRETVMDSQDCNEAAEMSELDGSVKMCQANGSRESMPEKESFNRKASSLIDVSNQEVNLNETKPAVVTETKDVYKGGNTSQVSQAEGCNGGRVDTRNASEKADTGAGEEFTEAVSVLGSDLLYMYQRGVDVDVVLVVGEHRFYAHRCILTARSEYFSAMLSGGWTESTTNEVIIQGLTGDVLEKILLCIYGGLLDTFELALVAMGDMYNLSSLTMCMEYALLKDKCHFFHKPCSTCLSGGAESLAVTSTYGLTALHTDLLTWSTRHYSRLWPTRAFATLPQEILNQCERALQHDISFLNVTAHALDLEKVVTALRNLKWGEPVIAMATRLIGSCRSFLGRHLKSYVLNRQPKQIEREYRGMHVESMKELLVKATDFLREGDAIELLIELTERRERYRGYTGAARAEVECYLEFVSDVLELVEEYVVRNISQAISSSEWGQLSGERQEALKTAAGYVFVGGDSVPKQKKPVLSNKQGLKFTPKTGKLDAGKFGDPLHKSRDVALLKRQKQDSYTGHQQVMKAGKTQHKTTLKTKVKPRTKVKVTASSGGSGEGLNPRETVDMTKVNKNSGVESSLCLSSQGASNHDNSGAEVLVNQSVNKLQGSSNGGSSLFRENETGSTNETRGRSETTLSFTDSFRTALNFNFIKPE